ncbi:MAG: hypothetical protein DI551_01580 [Micavibrio aeruginosavorus]|uniref:Colicin D C-terminal domain-containing protein n=1 Tax=Micavibrio aeruginosavorus TaxID=349221 RepID=A0A2W5N828_9BACT|nr:MAG: hypothetical protein DI551_01580 [Micavibrio aeruginosavorus]
MVQQQPALDAINPTWSPFDFIGWGAVPAAKFAGQEIAAKIAAKQLARAAAKRDVSWVRNTPMGQFQSKFKHAEIFGIKGNPNKKSLEAYKKAIEQHVKSPNTVVKQGTYHKKPMTHYYNEKTGINVMRDGNGKFKSAWKLTKSQKEHIRKGNLGGGKK